jgi:hypothetical protein
MYTGAVCTAVHVCLERVAVCVVFHHADRTTSPANKHNCLVRIFFSVGLSFSSSSYLDRHLLRLHRLRLSSHFRPPLALLPVLPLFLPPRPFHLLGRVRAVVLRHAALQKRGVGKSVERVGAKKEGGRECESTRSSSCRAAGGAVGGEVARLLSTDKVPGAPSSTRPAT